MYGSIDFKIYNNMNEKAEFAVRVLKEYALENQIPARSTSDLSPMEQWLILRLFAVSNSEGLQGRELLLDFCCHLNKYKKLKDIRFDFMMQDYLDEKSQQ